MCLLVPAHPGCPGQNPQSHKTVVCVCVCVCVPRPFFGRKFDVEIGILADHCITILLGKALMV